MLQTVANQIHSVKINSIDSGLNCSHILYGKSRQYFAEWAGHLSLKSFSGGQAFYDTGTGRYAVDESSYLLLNEMQPYSITIDSASRVESFCIFFEKGFAEEVNRSLTADPVQLVDDPEKMPAENVNFIPRLYSRDSLENILSELKRALAEKKAETVWLKEKLHEMMLLILQTQKDVFKEIEQLPPARASTRAELYKRVYRARDFIAATYHLPVTLDEMAKIACLSPNHFLRSFKQVFHQSPHQYLTRLRINHARQLLEQTDLTVTTVCQAVGFESHGSFSWLFRRHTGFSPEKYRRRKR